MNSSSLPASFVLVLPHPVPVSTSVINSIQEVTGKICLQGDHFDIEIFVVSLMTLL